MKKITVFFEIAIVLILSGCAKVDAEDVLARFKESFFLPEIIDDDYPLEKSFVFEGHTIIAQWESTHENVMSCNGIIQKSFEDQSLELTVTFSLDTKTTTKNFSITVSAFTHQERIAHIQSSITVPESTNHDITLPTNVHGVMISWSSTHPLILSASGKYTESESDTLVSLTGLFFYEGEFATEVFEVLVLAPTAQQRVQTVWDELSIPSVISSSLPLYAVYNQYVTATWNSNHPDILRNDGVLFLDSVSHTITLTVNLSYGGYNMTKTFTTQTTTIAENETHFPLHTFIKRASEFENSSLVNLTTSDDKIELDASSLIGYYESGIIKTNEFTSLVGSFAAVTNLNNSVDLEVKVRVNGTWSDYFSFGEFSLGKENKAFSVNQFGAVARLSIDELMVNNNLKADAFMFKVTLKRTTLNDSSPILSLVAATLEIPNYHYGISDSLPDFVDHDVPQLNQNIVPVIGNSICSPTSITMLLQYKGHSFADKDEFEHRYIAQITRDYGHNIYGNWVFNTNTMGAYGHDAYVQRMYSFEELQYHLHTIGPVAASVRGNMQGLYTTNGHLIVVRGYRVTSTGTKVITNDPNLQNVYFEYDLSTFMEVWRNIVYVIE